MGEIGSVTRFEGRGVALDCPVGWWLGDDGRNANLPLLLCVAAPVSHDGFSPNVVITEGKMDSRETLAHWVSESVELLQRIFPGFHLIDMTDSEVAGQPAMWLVACYTSKGWPLIVFQWLWLERGGRCRVTATGTCTLQVCGEMEPVFTGIVQSYRRQEQ